MMRATERKKRNKRSIDGTVPWEDDQTELDILRRALDAQ
jgi:hypothetical protein